MPNLPPETPWYIALCLFALYGVWKLIQPYLAARLKNAADESTAVSESRINRIELEQRRQIAEFESEKARQAHLGNLVTQVQGLVQAFIESNKNGTQERAAWLGAMQRTAVSLEALQNSVDALPERIAEILKAEKETAHEHERSTSRD